MNKWLKVTFFICLLIGAGYFFGVICRQIGQAYELLLSPSMELLPLFLRFLLALSAVTVSSGLVAALLRPIWLGFIAFALSGLAMLMAWEITLENGILSLVYILAGMVYMQGVFKELNQRIKFSVRPISQSQSMLMMALILAVCGSLYFTFADHIEREGFSIPETYIMLFVGQMEKFIVNQMPLEMQDQGETQFKEEFRHMIDGFFERTVKPYEQFIPLAIAVSLFMPLMTITTFLLWIPTMALTLIFPLLMKLGVLKIVTETKEVQKITLFHDSSSQDE